MSRTRYAALDRRAAWLVLLATLASSIALSIAMLGAEPSGAGNDPESSDLDLYAAITERMREGEPYYEAAHTELVDRGYGVQSVFNWRTPAYARILAWAPSDGVAQAGLAVLAGAAAVLTVVILGRLTGRWGRIAGALVVPMTLLAAFLPGTVLLAELTAGVLIMLAVGLHSLDRRWGALICGAAALFIRELAGLFVVVALVIAVRQRRWREVAAWVAVLASYAAYFLWHRQQVMATVRPDDPAFDDGWLQLGGPTFAVRTAQMDGVLLILPLAVIGAVIPFMVLGLWGWRGEAGLLAAVTLSAYLIAFCFVGKSVNAYWGAIYTPLLAFGMVLAPVAMRDLLRARGDAPADATSAGSTTVATP